MPPSWRARMRARWPYGMAAHLVFRKSPQLRIFIGEIPNTAEETAPMSTDWRDRRALNAINSTEAEGVALSETAKDIVTAISHGEIDADTVIDAFLATLTDDE